MVPRCPQVPGLPAETMWCTMLTLRTLKKMDECFLLRQFEDNDPDSFDETMARDLPWGALGDSARPLNSPRCAFVRVSRT